MIDRVGPTLRPEGPPQGYHQWRQLSFLHWEVPVAQVQATLPPGLQVDTFEGRGFVGLVPFTMQGIRPTRFLPPVPGLSAFHETNVRTYVLHEGGAPGVWFYSLDAASSVAVRAARWGWHLPYFRADMRLEQAGDRLRYASTRRWPEPLPGELSLELRVGDRLGPAEPGSLHHFLAERYLLYAADPSGRVWRGAVHHPPYPLFSAEVLALREGLVAAAGFSTEGLALPTLFSPGVDVEVFPLGPL